jgi:hypothetical protein
MLLSRRFELCRAPTGLAGLGLKPSSLDSGGEVDPILSYWQASGWQVKTYHRNLKIITIVACVVWCAVCFHMGWLG